MKKCLVLFLTGLTVARALAQQPAGVPITYQLPATPGQTYCVTLAVTDPANPRWIVSNFLAAAPRTVTAENKGKFTDYWNGLDENFMPVPPGKYGVKGIFMPAKKWKVDGEYHSIIPQYTTAALAWAPKPDPASDRAEPGLPFHGDPVGQPMRDVAVGPNGKAVFYYEYLENGFNNAFVDLNKPMGYEQFIRSYPSGGAGGGSSTATDGETVWSYSTDGGPKYVYRADQKSFGKSPGANRNNSYLPDGWVQSMAAWRDTALQKSFVYVAQRGKIVSTGGKGYKESDTEFVNKITTHDGENGQVLGEIPLSKPLAITVKEGVLYALGSENGRWSVQSVPLKGGLPDGTFRPVFSLPPNINPADMDVDSHGRFYVSDMNANKVYQLDKTGKVILTYGRLDAQKPGAYDPLTFILPEKLATWKDAEGNDRVLVVEQGGPNRVSEWSADGKLLREFISHQTKANDGYTYDPAHPEMIYIPGQKNWLTRFKVDYDHNKWTVDAVWPNVGDDPRSPHVSKPKFIRLNGREYLACGRSYNVYRHDGDRWLLSAALLRTFENRKVAGTFLWNDTNGDGKVEDEECRPTAFPANFFTYHGQNWLDDLSFALIGMGTKDVYRLAPDGFDEHGNPIFKEVKKLLTDPIYAAREAGTADALHGGNELDDKFGSDWSLVDGNINDAIYVQTRGGRGASANEGAQQRISRYLPDGKGQFKIDWRIGRNAINSTARPDEMYGGMRIYRPVNGILSVVDQSRCGLLLYTQDGLFVDNLFSDIRKVSKEDLGIYQNGGEFFAGSIFPNKDNGKIYIALGKYTPCLYEAQGWSLTENPVRPLTEVQKEVTISAAQIVAPPEKALARRGGVGAAKLARFVPGMGQVALDGGMAGWESVDPVTFGPDKTHSVEVRTLYRPNELLLRWHARLPEKFVAKPIPALERIFTHDNEAVTLGFYIQGNVNAAPGGAKEGRPGDVRFVTGLFTKDGQLQPVLLGMYPEWKAPGAKTQIYRTPVGQATFAYTGPVTGAQLGYQLDADGKGFVIAASIPRSAIPALAQPFDGTLKTLGNFDANFGGHNKFWWANSDGSASTETFDEPTEARLYPSSWAPIQFQGMEGGVMVRNWLILGPFGGPEAEQWSWNVPQAQKIAIAKFYEAATYPPDNWVVDPAASFGGDLIRGWWVKSKHPVTWKPAEIADLDTRVSLFDAGALGYAATWVHVPQDTELEFDFHNSQMAFYRWSLNGQPITGLKYEPLPNSRVAVAKKTLTLKSGWNQIMARAYCYAYAPAKLGLVFNGPTDKLMTVSLSAKPPAPGQ